MKRPKLMLSLLLLAIVVGNLALALMRDAKRDETLYIRDAAIMADCLREGHDAALIACGKPVHSAVQAAEILASDHGISVQVWNSASLPSL